MSLIGSGSGGAITVANDLFFADVPSRDGFFSANPSRLKDGVYVSVNGELQKYKASDDSFQTMTPVLQGQKGDSAPGLTIQYSANGTSGWTETLNTSLHKYWRWSSDGGVTWSPDGVRYSAASAATGIPDPYSYQVGANGKLQLFRDDQMIMEQDEEGAWLATSIATGTGSLHIGELHNNGSGGEQVVWVNEDSQIAYFPPWGGISVDGSTQIGTEARVHSDLQTDEPDGSPAGAGSIDYDYDFTSPAKICFHRVDLMPAETFSGRVKWRVVKSTGKEVAAFYREVNLVDGQIFELRFNYPLWAGVNQTFRLTLTKDDGTIVKVRPSSGNLSLPYRKNYYTTYEDYAMFHAGNPSVVGQELSNLTGSDRIAASAIRDFPAAGATEYGMVKVGPTMTIDGDGKLDANVAAAEKKAVSDETAMLALPQISNLYIVTRTDVDKLFYLNANEDPAEIGNWEEGASVGDTVSSFNGRSGAVVPATGDYNQKQIKTIHDDTAAEGWFGIDNTGIYWETP